MQRELGIARCGLACCLCSENVVCKGCKRDGFKHEAVLVLLPDADAMIELRNDNAYLVIHGGDDTLDRIAGQLAAAEGLFYYKSPVHPSLLEDQPAEA